MNEGFGELRGELKETQAMVLGLHRTLTVGAIAIIVALIGILGTQLT